MIRYEVETRWKENGRMLAWGYIGEYKREEMARELVKRLRSLPRKVTDWDIRIVKVVYGITTIRSILPDEDQLTLPGMIQNSKNFVSGLPIPRDSAWQPEERIDA